MSDRNFLAQACGFYALCPGECVCLLASYYCASCCVPGLPDDSGVTVDIRVGVL